MTLKEFETHIESFPPDTLLARGISQPFSWRGIYDEVAFCITDSPMFASEMLRRIRLAYTGLFVGWKGGDYRYHDYTPVHFEEDQGEYTDGGYAADYILRLTMQDSYHTMERMLAQLAFTVHKP